MKPYVSGHAPVRAVLRTSLLATTALALGVALAGPAAQAGTITVATGSSSANFANFNFGNVLVGQTGATKDVVVLQQTANNSRTVTANITSGAGNFGVAPASGVVNNNPLTFNFSFAPTSTGTKTMAATLTAPQLNGSGVNSAANNPAFTRSISGTGTGVAPAATLSSSRTAFGNVLVGSSNQTATLTIQNTGNGNAAAGSTNSGIYNLNLTNLSSSGSAFAVAGGTTASLTDNATTTRTVTFAPTSTGNASSTVTASFSNGIGTANSSGTRTVMLGGTGVAPVANLSTTQTGGYVLVGTTGTAGAVQVQNTGNGNLAGADAGGAFNANTSTNLRLSGLGSSNAAFAVAPPATASLTDGSTTSRAVSFTATGRGAASTIVTGSFNNGIGGSNASGSLVTTVAAQGVAPVVGTIGGSGAGNVRVGDTGTGTITVKNAGDGNLAGSGTQYNLNGAASLPSSAFALIGGTPFSLTDGATATITYAFTPTTRGGDSDSAVLNFSNGRTDGTNAATVATTTVSGTGVGPEFSSNYGASQAAGSNAVVDFGTITAGGTTSLSFIISNVTPDADLGDLTKLSILGASLTNGTVFSISPWLTTALIPGGGLALTLSFIGLAPGVFTDLLTIATDQGAAFGMAGQSFQFSLQGTVVAAVPEPMSLALFGAGLVGLGVATRSRRRAG